MGEYKNRTCKRCEGKFPENEMKKINGKYYCEACAKIIKEEKKKDKKEKEDEEIKINEIDREAYEDLKKYILDIYDGNNQYLAINYKQIKNLTTLYEWKYQDILNTLKYYFELSEDLETFKPEKGIQGVVEKYYAKAYDFYKELEILNSVPKEEIRASLNLPTKVVYINQQLEDLKEQRAKERLKTKLYGDLIDISLIDCSEDEEE